MEDNGLICVRVYFKEKEFIEASEYAKKVGLRPLRLKAIKKKPHGWANETITDTKGLAKFMKFCIKYWKDNEAYRMAAAAALEAEDKAHQAEMQRKREKLGIL